VPRARGERGLVRLENPAGALLGIAEAVGPAGALRIRCVLASAGGW
jgi:hypothetical protein